MAETDKTVVPPVEEEGWETEPEEEEEEYGYEEEEEEEDVTLTNPEVVLKYKAAGRFTNQVLEETAAKCVAGASVFELCQEADARIKELCATVFTKQASRRKVARGIGFPPCISVNNIVCHYSPASEDSIKLSEGDVVRIDLGANVCGFMAQAATTTIVGGPEKLPAVLKTKADDVFTAARIAHEAAIRLMRPGNTNQMITDTLEGVAEAYGVNACEGVLSHRMEHEDPETEHAIVQKRVPGSEPAQRVDTVTFETGQVWQLDVLFSTGGGRLRLGDARPNVFRKGFARERMRMRSAREVLAVTQQRTGSYAFGMRDVADVKAARFGVQECVRNGILISYPVLYERGAEVVVHLKATVLILPKEILRASFVALPTTLQVEAPRPIPELAAESLKRGLNLAPRKKKAKK